MATQAPAELESQYRALRESCALVEPDGVGALLVTGPDAVEFLQGQVTNDVAALEPGHGCYALLLNPKGRILADMRILMLGKEELLLDSEQDELLRKNLDMYRIGRQVEVAPAGSTSLYLIGPGAAEVAGSAPPAAEHSFVEAEVDGAPVLVVRTWIGVDVVYPADRANVLDTLRQRATETASREAAEIVRIEGGRPRYGVDMTADNLPGELGLEERAVSFTKGCYVGQEIIIRVLHRGGGRVARKLVGLSAATSDGQLDARMPIVANGRPIGHVTSAARSPRLGRSIALGYVHRDFAEPGTPVTIGSADTSIGATVVPLPFRSPSPQTD
jgi:tRNA-modifying protein YgfZ